MFLTPSARNAIKSSAIQHFEVNQETDQVLVTFNSGKSYLYSNVNYDNLYELCCIGVKSFGAWVNKACVNDAEVSTFNLASA